MDERFGYDEEEKWLQATWSDAATSQAKEELPSSETSRSLDPGPSPTLLTIPPNIRAIRDQVFYIREEITWTAEQFDEYWGYMDNFWVLNSTRPIKNGKQTSAEKSQGSKQRAKKIRIVEACGMKLIMYKIWKGDQLISVTLSRNEKSRGKDVVCYEHNHSLEYLDTIKVNLKVKNTVAAEVAKGYRPSDINRNIKGVKWAANKKALEDARGVHLDLKKIHNARATWKRQNPDMRIAGARIKWEDQLEECLVVLQALPAEVAVMYEIITVQRKTDGRISHGIIFGKLSRLQTLMRRGHLTLMDATHNTNRLH